MSTKVIGVNEVADQLGVTPKGLRGLILKRQVPAPFKIGSLLKWHPDAIENFIKQKTDEANKQSTIKKRGPGRPRNTHTSLNI